MANLIIRNQGRDGALEEINSALRAGGLEIQLQSEQLSDLIEVLDEVAEAGEFARIELRLPPTDKSFMELLVPNTYYHVNIKRASLWSVAILLDAIKTGGFAVGLLAAHGLLKTACSRLSPETGEFCNFIQAADSHKAGEAILHDTISDRITGKDCPFPQVGCNHLQSAKCDISTETIQRNLQTLEEKGALIRDGEELKIPL